MTDSNWSDAVWHKSSRSAGSGNCLEVAVQDGMVAIRDSKDPGGPVLTIPIVEFRSFVRWVRSGGAGAV